MLQIGGNVLSSRLCYDSQTIPWDWHLEFVQLFSPLPDLNLCQSKFMYDSQKKDRNGHTILNTGFTASCSPKN